VGTLADSVCASTASSRATVDTRTSLLDLLRDDLGNTSPKKD
jgi:aerobic-type carbon monoxide dehydrogenase small subunit (CoxS/CutS family)